MSGHGQVAQARGEPTPTPQSAAAPSPFPPIADYAFLSELPHRRAGRARRRDRLAVRPALRLAERVRHPARPRGRRLPAGAVRHQRTRRPASTSRARTRSLTTWKTPTGWIMVRDALTMGPRRGEDEITPHTRPPADDDGDHMLVRTVLCLDGRRRGRAGLRAGLRLRPRAGRVDAGRTATATRPTRAAPGQTIRLQTDMAIGIEGDRVRARHVARAGRAGLTARSRGPRSLAAPEDVDEANARLAATTRFWRSWLGRARLPDHRWREPIQRSALAIKGLTYMPTGATVAALTTSLPGDAGRRAQLGLPLHLDARLDVHAPGAALPQPRLGGGRVHAVRRRPRAERGRRAADHVRDRRPPRPDRVDPRRPLRATRARSPVRIGNGAFDQRQNDVFGAVLDSILLHTRRSERLPRRLWPIVQSQAECADRGLARARPGHLGGPRRAAALRVVEAHVLGGDGPRREAGRHPRRRGAARHAGARPPRRSRPTSSSTASGTACCASTTRPTRWTRRRCWRRSSGSCPRDDERLRKSVLRDRRRPDRGRLRAALPDRRDRRRPVGQGGKLPDLLVLAGVGARDHRRAAARPRPDGAAAARGLAARACTPRSSTRAPAATWATSRRRSRTSP